MRRARRTTRFTLHCEPLESRQLLSIGQTGLAAGVLVNPFAGIAQLSVPAIVSNDAPPSYLNIEIEFEALGGLNQIQIVFLGSAPVFSPTPASSSGGSGPGLGTVSGSPGNSSNGLITTTGSTSNFSITPLNPSLTPVTNPPGAPVYLVPPPFAPLAVHLGASATPATTISNSTMISNLDDQPPSMTHVGQADSFAGRRLFMERLYVTPRGSSLIDDIEPFGPLAPIEVPEAQPVPQGAQPQAQTPARSARCRR